MGNSNLIKCFCKARNTQAFITKCLDDSSLSENEREELFDIITKQVEVSNKLQKIICRHVIHSK